MVEVWPAVAEKPDDVSVGPRAPAVGAGTLLLTCAEEEDGGSAGICDCSALLVPDTVIVPSTFTLCGCGMAVPNALTSAEA